MLLCPQQLQICLLVCLWQVENAGSFCVRPHVFKCDCDVAETMCLTFDTHTPNGTKTHPIKHTHVHMNPRAVCHWPLTGVTKAGWVGRKERGSLGPLRPSHPSSPFPFLTYSTFCNALTVTPPPLLQHAALLAMSAPQDRYIICPVASRALSVSWWEGGYHASGHFRQQLIKQNNIKNKANLFIDVCWMGICDIWDVGLASTWGGWFGWRGWGLKGSMARGVRGSWGVMEEKR